MPFLIFQINFSSLFFMFVIIVKIIKKRRFSRVEKFRLNEYHSCFSPYLLRLNIHHLNIINDLGEWKSFFKCNFWLITRPDLMFKTQEINAFFGSIRFDFFSKEDLSFYALNNFNICMLNSNATFNNFVKN